MEGRKWNSCNSGGEKVERESLGGRRKTNMLFEDVWDKLPSEGGCASTRASLSYSKLRAALKVQPFVM